MEVVRLLLGRFQLYGITRSRQQDERIVLIQGDIADRSTYDPLPHDIAACIHLAAAIPHNIRNNTFEELSECIGTNLEGTRQLLRCLRSRQKECYFLLASSVTVYGSRYEQLHEDLSPAPDTSYGMAKYMAENLVGTSGLNHSILRFSALYDAEGKSAHPQKLLYDWTARGQAGKPLTVWGTGEDKRNYLHVKDAAEVVERAVVNEIYGLYNVASNVSWSSQKIAATIAELTGKGSPVEFDPARQVYAPFSGVNIEKAQKELSFEPKIDLKTGITQIIAHGAK